MQRHGFILEMEAQLPELDSKAKIWRHEKSGAQLLSICNQDENKVFGVSFRTPPADSTGLPHILEHSVLCGSKKYPTKEPFVELLKGSLQTFLNAFTYPDKTCYPVASANLKDFYNLIDVYLDAVFHPLIPEEVLLQEGWRLEADKADAPLTYKGVVYNEMKGVFSSPEAVLSRQSLHALFPDTVYGLESGGEPEEILKLTYNDFIAFHKRYYHPANGRFYFWGDDPEDRRLELLDAVLQDFAPAKVQSAVTRQQPFKAPRSVSLPFAAGEDDKAMFTLNWVLPEPSDRKAQTRNTLALRMLEHALLGLPASPLRRALIESGLGEDLAGDGLEAELLQPVFSIGLKGIEAEDAPEVEKLVLDTLEELARPENLAPYLEAAINSVEFALRENNTGRFPVGLAVMLQALVTWLHDQNPQSPLDALLYEENLAIIKAGGAGYFSRLLKESFLENRHRVSVLLLPDKKLAAQREEAEKAALAAIEQKLSPAEKDALLQTSARLKAMQEAPDSPEALATIPRLSLADLPRENRVISQQHFSLPELGAQPGPEARPVPQSAGQDAPAAPCTGPGTDCGIFFHPQPTHGITYLNVTLDINAVPDRLLPLLPLLGRSMLEMGTTKRDFVDLNMRIAEKTGGMDSDLMFMNRQSSPELPVTRFCLGGKATNSNLAELFSLAQEVLVETKLDDPERFSLMLLEEKARLEHSLVPSGHAVISARLKAGLAPATGPQSQIWPAMLEEQCNGISYLQFIRALNEKARNNWPAVLADLEELRTLLLNRNTLSISLTAEQEKEAELLQRCAGLFAGLPAPAHKTANRSGLNLPQREALITPAQVNYVGKGVNLFEHGYNYHGSAMVIMKYLRTGRLWEQIRVVGGAYGAFCSLERASGALLLASYRDPNIAKTLQAYDEAAKWLAKEAPTQEALEAAIVGAIGDLDAHLLPEAKGHNAFVRALARDNAELRAKLREEVLSANKKHFKEFGEVMAAALPHAKIAALGGNALEQLALKEGWEINRVL